MQEDTRVLAPKQLQRQEMGMNILPVVLTALTDSSRCSLIAHGAHGAHAAHGLRTDFTKIATGISYKQRLVAFLGS